MFLNSKLGKSKKKVFFIKLDYYLRIILCFTQIL